MEGIGIILIGQYQELKLDMGNAGDNMYDEHIEELLQNTYNCTRVKKLGTHQSTFEVERKERIGVKSKFLGIFPIYEYKRWNVTLSHWTYRDIRFRNNFTGRVSSGANIAICFDEESNTCFWRYV